MTFGRYREGSTLAYRLDPRTKMAFALVLVVAVFKAGGPVNLAVLALAAVASLAASGVGVRDALGMLKPFAWLMIFVLVFNSLFASAGIWYGLESVVRFAIVLLGTSSLMVTTSPTELADGMALLLRPLERVGLHTEDLCLSVSMTLRFVPVVLEEFERVREAQLARHAHLGQGGAVQRVRAYLPVLVPTFASAIRRSRTLAAALENRGYGLPSKRGRTCIRAYRLTALDAVVLLVCVALIAFA